MPYGVGATVSDILLVILAGVIDVFSLYTRSTWSVWPVIIKPLSGYVKVYIAILFYALVYDDDDDDDAGQSSGAGTNLKVGETCQARSAWNFFCRAAPLFGFTITISRFGEHFPDGQYSLNTFLFFVLLLLTWFSKLLIRVAMLSGGRHLPQVLNATTPLYVCVAGRPIFSRHISRKVLGLLGSYRWHTTASFIQAVACSVESSGQTLPHASEIGHSRSSPILF